MMAAEGSPASSRAWLTFPVIVLENYPRALKASFVTEALSKL
jgi:hypothetical protein